MDQTPTISIHNWTGEIVKVNFTNGDYTTPDVSVPPSALATFPYYYSDASLTGDIWVLWESSRFQLPIPRRGNRHAYLGFLVDPDIVLPSGDATRYTYSPAGYRKDSAYTVWRNEYSPADVYTRPRDLYIALPLYTMNQLQEKTLVTSLSPSSIVEQGLEAWQNPPTETGLYDAAGQPVDGDDDWGYMFWVFLAAFLVIVIVLVLVAFAVGYFRSSKSPAQTYT